MAFTYFFRDGQTLQLVVEQVLPELKTQRFINVWDAGCAMGPEPYSLAIILRENMGHFLFRNVRIYATDIDESNLFGEIIARGVYSDREVGRIPRDLLDRYFKPAEEPNIYRICEEMRRSVQYQRHDLLSLRPVRDGLGLIMCKNVLLHFSHEERIEVLRMFHRSLAPDGFLVTAQTQKLPVEVEGLFQRVTMAGQVFKKASACAAEGVAMCSLETVAS